MTFARVFDSFLRIMGVLFCLWLLVEAGFWALPYADALVWHVEHGNFAYVGEYQVPVAAWVRPDGRESLLSMELRPKKFGYVKFAFGKVIPGEKRMQELEAYSKSPDLIVARRARNFLAKKSTLVTIADQPSRCVDDFDIHCFPERQETGLTVDFIGSHDMEPVFYEMLSKISRKTHN